MKHKRHVSAGRIFKTTFSIMKMVFTLHEYQRMRCTFSHLTFINVEIEWQHQRMRLVRDRLQSHKSSIYMQVKHSDCRALNSKQNASISKKTRKSLARNPMRYNWVVNCFFNVIYHSFVQDLFASE